MRNDYYRWLISKVCDSNYDSRYYSKLLFDLDNIEFVWSIPLDENRAIDGLELRNAFGIDRNGPCSMLEMMVALSLRIIEDGYLSEGGENPFFWGMIKSLGLYFNDDYDYDSDLTDSAVSKMLNHEYEYDGSNGALFVVKEPLHDMRETQIWMQAMWYIAELDRQVNKGWLD